MALGEGQEKPYELLKVIEPPSPEDNAYFGWQISMAGDRLVIGEGGAGRAHIYDRDGKLIKTLNPPDSGNGTRFGWSVVIVGDFIVIGEPGAVVDGFEGAGLVHIYDHDGNFVRTVSSPHPYEDAGFGYSLATDGIRIAVGEPAEIWNDRATNSRAYVMVVDGRIIYSVTRPVERIGSFGWSVAVSGDTLLVGEPYAVTETTVGLVHVYSKGILRKSLVSPINEGWARVNFGNSIGIGSDVVAIGAVRQDANSTKMAGIAHLYNLDLTLLRNLYPQKPKQSGYYGVEVTVSDLFVSVTQWGYVYLYDHSGRLVSTVSEESFVNAAFGMDVAIDGDRLAVGAMSAYIGGKEAGMVQLYKLNVGRDDSVSSWLGYVLAAGLVVVVGLGIVLLMRRVRLRARVSTP
jgi:hypothetical protein